MNKTEHKMFDHADEIRELRDHAPGDPLKRVAWKASARRGRLLVREMEREEGDVVCAREDGEVGARGGGVAAVHGAVPRIFRASDRRVPCARVFARSAPH